MQARPDNEDCNMKFLRALPPSWSQVAITLKTKGGLDFLSFDDLYNKLRTLEIDVKGNVLEKCSSLFLLLKVFTTTVTYEDFDQLARENLISMADRQWLSVSESIDLKRRLCYQCSGVGTFARECTGKEGDSRQGPESEAMEKRDSFSADGVFVAAGNGSDGVSVAAGVGADGVSVAAGVGADSVSVASSDATDAETEFALMGLSPQVQSCPFDCNHIYTELKKEFDNLEVQYKECFLQVQAYKSSLQNLEQQKSWITSDNMIQGQTWGVYSRFEKWKEFFQKTSQMINSSMSSRSKLDCDFYENQLRLNNAPVWKNVENIPSFVPRPAYVPAGSRNRPTSVPAGRPFPTGSRTLRPTSVPAGRPFPAGWHNPAARPMTRPKSHYFQQFSWPGSYNQMDMDGGRWGTAVKTSAGCSWQSNRPYMHWGSKNNGGSHQSYRVFIILTPQRQAQDNPHTNKDIGIVDSGCSRSMTGNKEKLADFVKIKGGTVTFGGGDGKITGKGTIRTSNFNFENVYYVEELQNFNLFSVSQICDTKNKVLFTDSECLVLSKEFKLPDFSQVVLRVPRRHNLYCSLVTSNPEREIKEFVAKAS
ncbi:hypothetical protein Tco_0336746 [Tanacetum coccineum]